MKKSFNFLPRPAFAQRPSATAAELPREIRDLNYFCKTSADAR
jgi:hypothetical protein